MGLRDIGASLPPGFRFFPSDEELICHYLYKKIANEEVLKGTLVEVDLHTCEPWQLPEVAKLNSAEWYFFSFRDRKYATGFRTNRATTSGYWKATGKDRTVVDPRTSVVIGMRKTLVFYKNRAPNGIKTGWIMHEFRLENPHIPPKEDWVLCRVFHKGKDGNNVSNNLSPENMYETSVTSPELVLSPLNMDNHATLPKLLPYGGGYRPTGATFFHSPTHHSQNSSNFQLSQEINKVLANEMAQSKCGKEDEFGFFYDMSFEDTGLQDGGDHSCLGDMKFEDENSLVFI